MAPNIPSILRTGYLAFTEVEAPLFTYVPSVADADADRGGQKPGVGEDLSAAVDAETHALVPLEERRDELSLLRADVVVCWNNDLIVEDLVQQIRQVYLR